MGNKCISESSAMCVLQVQLTQTSRKSSVFSGSKFELVVVGKATICRARNKEEFLEMQDSASAASTEASDTDAPIRKEHKEGKLSYIVTCSDCEGLAYRSSRLWEDIIEERPLAKKGT